MMRELSRPRHPASRTAITLEPAALRLALGMALAMPALAVPTRAFAQTEAPALAPIPPAPPAHAQLGRPVTGSTPSQAVPLQPDPSQPAPPQPGPALAGPTQALSPSGLQSRLGRQQAAALEAHITALHRNWHITPAQEPLWSRFTGTMRHGAAQLDTVYARREQQSISLGAIDELRSYALVQQTHASNAADLVVPFQTLYDSFSVAQKRLADQTVRRFTESALRAPR